MKKLNTNAGFTLAELLIVVAIIAVLVAISIPVFSAQLERSRENTDLANMRAAKAEILAYALEPSDQYVLNASGVKGSDATTKFETNEKFADTLTTAPSHVYVYDATTGDLAVPTYKATPYGKGTTGGDYKKKASNCVLYVAVDVNGTVVGCWAETGTSPTTDWQHWNKLYEVKDPDTNNSGGGNNGGNAGTQP